MNRQVLSINGVLFTITIDCGIKIRVEEYNKSNYGELHVSTSVELAKNNSNVNWQFARMSKNDVLCWKVMLRKMWQKSQALYPLFRCGNWFSESSSRSSWNDSQFQWLLWIVWEVWCCWHLRYGNIPRYCSHEHLVLLDGCANGWWVIKVAVTAPHWV